MTWKPLCSAEIGYVMRQSGSWPPADPERKCHAEAWIATFLGYGRSRKCPRALHVGGQLYVIRRIAHGPEGGDGASDNFDNLPLSDEAGM